MLACLNAYPSPTKLLGGMVSTDTCNTAQLTRQTLCDAIIKEGREAGLEDDKLLMFQGNCHQHLRNILADAGDVGTLPQGYVRNVPLPRIPLRQSTSSNQIHMIPDYYEVPHGVPPYDTSRSIVENAAYAYSPAWHAIAINT